MVAPDGDEVVIALFIVAYEQILGVGLRVGERHVRELGHVVDRLVLRDLVPDPAVHAATLGIQRLPAARPYVRLLLAKQCGL